MLDLIGQIFWSFVLLGIVLVFFCMIAGVKADNAIRIYVNIIVKVVEIIGELLVKLAIPVLKQIGAKIVYVTNHYLQTHPTKPAQIPANTQQSATNNGAPDAGDAAPYTPPQDKGEKQPSANPYDDPPEPEIME